LKFQIALDTALFAGATAVMRNRSYVLNRADFQADGLQGADGGFTAGTGPFDPHFDFAHTVGHRRAGGVLRDLLRSESGALAGAFESHFPSGRPAQQVAVHVGDCHLGVVEGG